jgi:two-component system response regulator HydG
VRELENEVQRLADFAGERGVVTPGVLSPAILGRPAPAPAAPAASADEAPITGVWPLEELEKAMVLRAMKHARGNRTVAARLLGIPKSTLYRRFEKHGIQVDTLDDDDSNVG